MEAVSGWTSSARAPNNQTRPCPTLIPTHIKGQLQKEISKRKHELDAERTVSLYARLHIALLEAQTAVGDAMGAAAAGHPVGEWGDAVNGAVAELARCMRRVGAIRAASDAAAEPSSSSGAPECAPDDGGPAGAAGRSGGKAAGRHDRQECDEEECSELMEESIGDEAAAAAAAAEEEEDEELMLASQQEPQLGGGGIGELPDVEDGSVGAVGVTTSAFIDRCAAGCGRREGAGGCCLVERFTGESGQVWIHC